MLGRTPPEISGRAFAAFVPACAVRTLADEKVAHPESARSLPCHLPSQRVVPGGQIERQIGRIDRHSVGAGGKSGARIDMQAVGGVGDDQVSRVFPAVRRRADEADV